MKHLITALYRQAIHDYYDYMLGKRKNEYDIKCIFNLFDSDLLDSEMVYKIIDELNHCVTVMTISKKVPDNCPEWLVKKFCKYNNLHYKKIKGELVIYE